MCTSSAKGPALILHPLIYAHTYIHYLLNPRIHYITRTPHPHTHTLHHTHIHTLHHTLHHTHTLHHAHIHLHTMPTTYHAHHTLHAHYTPHPHTTPSTYTYTPHPHTLPHNTHILHAHPNTHLHSTVSTTHCPHVHTTHIPHKLYHPLTIHSHTLYHFFLVLMFTIHFYTESQSLKSLSSSSEFCSWAICSAFYVYCIHFVKVVLCFIHVLDVEFFREFHPGMPSITSL